MESFVGGRRVEARQRLGLESDAVVILFVGRFVPLKGIERLMEAVALIDEANRTRLVLVGGDGPQAASTARLQKRALRLGLAQKIVFAGRVEHGELANYYNAANLLALPSYYESFGLVVLESLACGTPVVAMPVGIVPSVVRNGENGLVVRDPTGAALARSLSQVVAWEKAGQIEHERVRASVGQYTWPAVAQCLSGEYGKAIEAHANAALRIGSSHSHED
jgi:D-inositol-3-phosphate glycosyltransferase